MSETNNKYGPQGQLALWDSNKQGNIRYTGKLTLSEALLTAITAQWSGGDFDLSVILFENNNQTQNAPEVKGFVSLNRESKATRQRMQSSTGPKVKPKPAKPQAKAQETDRQAYDGIPF